MQSSSQIVIWTLDATWKRDLSVSAQRIDLSSTAAVESRENIFAVDFNGGGIGSQLPVLSDLEVAGSTKLQRDASGKLYANGVAIYNTFGGETHLTVNPFAGHTVVAVEDLGAAGKQLVMQSSSQIVIWTLDATWKRDMSIPVQRHYLTEMQTVAGYGALFGVSF